MNSQYRDIIKHAGVYGAGQILSRMASVFLLPLYTRFLTPADYGCIALLDLTTSILGILAGSGMVTAANRYHFDTDDVDDQARVWWTTLIVLAVTAAAVVLPGLLARNALALAALGPEETRGGLFFALALGNLAFTTISQPPDRLLRVQKRSSLCVAISLGSLLLNIALNVYFLVDRRLGVAGVLTGNLITGAVTAFVQCALLARSYPRVRFDFPLALKLGRFGAPMIATALMSTAMHQADRYMLRLFTSLDQIGIYSLAYTVGQGINTLFLVPFDAVWSVMMYEIAAQPDAKRMYARVFEYFAYALMLLMFGVALFIRPVLSVLTASSYAGAADLVPIVCVGFIFFSVHAHFSVPAYLHKRTVSLLLPYTVGAVANVLLTLALVPVLGVAGAAWASAGAYALFSMSGLLRYRRIDRIDYPLARTAGVLAAMVLSYAACRYATAAISSRLLIVAIPALVWTAWFGALAARAVNALYPSWVALRLPVAEVSQTETGV